MTLQFDNPARRYEAAFTAGRMARQCIAAARSTLRIGNAEFRAGRTARALNLWNEAADDRRVFVALIRQGMNDQRFRDGYLDAGRTAPQTAAQRVEGLGAPNVVLWPGLSLEPAWKARQRAAAEDCARRARDPRDPDNRP